MSVLVLVVDDEPDVEALFRQQFRRDLRAQRFVMDFAISAADALTRIAGPIEQTLILILSDINMPGMTGLEMLQKAKEMRPEVPITMITAYGDPDTKRKASTRLRSSSGRSHRSMPLCSPPPERQIVNPLGIGTGGATARRGVDKTDEAPDYSAPGHFKKLASVDQAFDAFRAQSSALADIGTTSPTSMTGVILTSFQ